MTRVHRRRIQTLSAGSKHGPDPRKFLIELGLGDTAKLFSFAPITRAECLYDFGATVVALQVIGVLRRME